MLLQAVCIVTTIFRNFVRTSVPSFADVLTGYTSRIYTTLYAYSKQTNTYEQLTCGVNLRPVFASFDTYHDFKLENYS